MRLIKTADIKQKLDKSNITDPIMCQVATKDDQTWNNIDWNVIHSEEDLNKFLKNFIISGKAEKIIESRGKESRETLEKYDPDPYTEGLSYEIRESLELQLTRLSSWKSLLLKELDNKNLTYQYDYAFKYLALMTLAGSGSPNADALQNFYNILKNSSKRGSGALPIVPSNKNILRSYKKESDLIDSGSERLVDTSELNGWIEVPGGRDAPSALINVKEDIREIFKGKDFESINDRSTFLSDLCKGMGWCTGNKSDAERHLSSGSMFLYVVGGEPKVSISTNRYVNKIVEITGASNKLENAFLYADPLFDFYDNHPYLQKALDSYKIDSQQALPDFKVSVTKAKKLIEKWINADVEQITTYLEKEKHPRFWTESYSLISADNKTIMIDGEEREFKVGDVIVSDLVGRQLITRTSENYTAKGLKNVAWNEDMGKAVDFLTDKKIEECSDNEGFRIASKSFLLNGERGIYEREGPKFELQINRFPFLKKDKDVVDKGCELINMSLKGLYNGKDLDPAMVMGNCDPIRLNNKLRSMPMKRDDVRENAFNSYMSILKNKEKNSQFRKMFDDISKMIKRSGTIHLLKKKAKRYCLEYIQKFLSESQKGNNNESQSSLDKFDQIRMDFDLSEDIDGFKDEIIDEVLEIAPSMYVNDEMRFKNLDDFMNGKLTDNNNFPKILEKAIPIAETNMLGFLGDAQKIDIIDCFYRFPILKKRELVIKSVIKNCGDWISSKPDLFQKMDEIYDNELSKGDYYEKIMEISFGKSVTKAISFIFDRKYSLLKELDDNFKGRIISNETVIEVAVGRASRYLSDYGAEGIEFSSLMKAFKDQLTPYMEEIKSNAFEQQFSMICLYYSQGFFEEVINMNERLLGEVFKRKDQIIDASKNDAVNYLLENNLHIKTISDGRNKFDPNNQDWIKINPIYKVIQMDKSYNKELSKDERIIDACRDIMLEVSIYKKNKYYQGVSWLINKLFDGRQLVGPEDYENKRQEYKVNLKHKLYYELDSGNYKEFEDLMNSFPELKTDRQLVRKAIDSVYRMAFQSRLDPNHSLNIANELDMILDGQISSSKNGQIAYTEIRQNIKKLNNKKGEDTPPQNPPLEDPPPDNNLNAGNNWYNIFKTANL